MVPVLTWVRVFELDVFRQSPRTDGATRVRWNRRRRIARWLTGWPRLVWNDTERERSGGGLEITRLAWSTAGWLRRHLNETARRRRILGQRTGTRRRRSWFPAQHAPATRRKVGSTVDGWHGGTRRRYELETVGITSEQLVAAGPILVALDSVGWTTMTGVWSTASAASVCRQTRVVRTRTGRALRPSIAPSSTELITSLNNIRQIKFRLPS